MTTHDIGRHLRSYGVRSVKSPNLDALSDQGVRFARAFATAPQCSPSRASLATGMYPHNNGVMGLAHRGFDWKLAVPHAAAIFAGHGFDTHLFGSQHVTPHPERLGFDGVHPVVAFERVLGASEGRRLYLEVNFDETHRPYPPAGVPPADLVVPGYLPQIPAAVEEMTAVEQTITAMDAAAGRVFDLLEQAGRARDTFVVFTTDHGLAMPRAKCTLYDPGLEVALLVRWPAGGVSGGTVREDMVSNVDVLPTLLDAAGLASGEDMQGRSLLRDGGRDTIFAEKTFHSYYDPMRCIRTARHKYIRNFESAFAVEIPADIQAGPIFRSNPSRYSADRPSAIELYDLENDPLEQHNLAGRDEIADAERRLSAELWTWMHETKDPLLYGPIPSPRYRKAIQA
jgi:arylsulfatase A-like enzyme